MKSNESGLIFLIYERSAENPNRAQGFNEHLRIFDSSFPSNRSHQLDELNFLKDEIVGT